MKDGLLQTLHEIVGKPAMLVGTDIASHDPGMFMLAIKAHAIVRPRSTEQVSRVLAACNACGQSVVVQGGMSGWEPGTQTEPSVIVLSLEHMNKIERIDPFNRTALVQAGVVLQALRERVAEHGLCFPLDLGGRGSCQLGGSAATNAGGTGVLRYGMMRHQVLGLEVALADGRIVSSLNQMIMNNAGYDLKQLFIGSEGTLGVITRLVLRLQENPLRRSTALVSVEHFDDLITLFRTMDRALNGSLSAFEFLDHGFYRVNTGQGRCAAPLPRGRPFYAIIEASGTDEERDGDLIDAALHRALENELISGMALACSDENRRTIWDLRQNLEHIVDDFPPLHALDVTLPVTHMEAYMESVQERFQKRWPGGSICFFGHIGDGNLHIAAGAGTGSDEDREPVERCVYEPLASFHGSISAEHGVGLEKKPYLHISRNPGERRVMQDLKMLFDPKGILNPGRIFDRHPAARRHTDAGVV